MNYFKDMRDLGHFDDSNPIHLESLRFCFYGIIQDELTDVMHRWNTHRIRPVKNSESPSGRPDILYIEGNEYKRRVSSRDLGAASSFCKDTPMFGCKPEFSQLALLHMSQQNLTMPRSVSEAEDLYFILTTCI